MPVSTVCIKGECCLQKPFQSYTHIYTHMCACIYLHTYSAKLFLGSARKDWKPPWEVCFKNGPRVLGPPAGKACGSPPCPLCAVPGRWTDSRSRGGVTNEHLADREGRGSFMFLKRQVHGTDSKFNT